MNYFYCLHITWILRIGGLFADSLSNENPFCPSKMQISAQDLQIQKELEFCECPLRPNLAQTEKGYILNFPAAKKMINHFSLIFQGGAFSGDKN